MTNKEKLEKYCNDNELPIYNAPFYEEDEVCVKGALEPRHILGVTTYIDKAEVFVVNPYLFDFYENHLENFVKEGLPVDLERFYKIFPTTNCNGFFRFFKDNKFEEIK